MILPQVDWVAMWAGYTPDRLCLRDDAGGREWTYALAETRARAMAAHLRGLGVGRGDRVGVYAQNCPEFVFLFLACVKLGAILVPLNFRLTPAETDVLLNDAEPVLLVHDAAMAPAAAELTSAPEARATVDDLAPVIDAGEADFAPDRPGELDDPVMILYTAGTTGRSKGVIVTHRMLLWNSINTALRLDITSADHSQAYAPFFHTGGWNVLLTPFLHAGASHTLMSAFEPDRVLELMAAEGTTIFWGVPTMMRMLAESPRFADTDLSTVRYVVVGGAPMPLDLIDLWHARGVFIRQGYGLTEVGPNTFSLHHDDAVRKRGSIGFPNFYIDARAVRADGTAAGVDEPGELWLRSEVVTPGYWRRPEATAEAIVDGWFRTGDVVRRDAEGFWYVVDRKKNMFISGGENVYPAEVEAVLESHPDVAEAGVVGVPDPKWGEVGQAFLVTRDGAAPDPETLTAYCRERLAGYKTPRHFAFVAELPRNAVGKIDRKALEGIVDEK